MDTHFSGCEIIEIAIHIEETGKKFYNRLVNLTNNQAAVSTFKYLANAEEEHFNVFKQIFDWPIKS